MKNSYAKSSLICIILLGLLFSCSPPVQEVAVSATDSLDQEFLKVNRYSLDKHQDQIEAFVSRVGWAMEISPTGLWYHIDHQGNGKAVRKNSRVSFSFSSRLLDGTPCYEINEKNPKTIVVGKGGIEAGVEEGLMKMSEGDQAIFIIPPHLGHGNFGDRNKIPGNSVIIYKVRVLNVG